MYTPRISMIAAIGEKNRVLGKDNQLIWKIPEDTQYFRDTTKGHVVIMGRKTYESMGKPLPHRINIVVTTQKDFAPEGVSICSSIEEAIALGKETEEHELFIIGGGEIYTLGLPYADRLYLTLIEGDFSGDVFFPPYESIFSRVISEKKSEDNGYLFTYVILEKEQTK